MSEAGRDRKHICSDPVYDGFDPIGVPFNLHDEQVSPDDIGPDDQVPLPYRIV